MKKRFEYFLKLDGFDLQNSNGIPANLHFRDAQPKDADALAELMIEAYRGTIDYDGETLNDAIAEVRAFFAAQRGGEPLVNISRLAFTSTQLIGACLVADWQERQSPLIAYVMTHVKWKNQGIGKILLGRFCKTFTSRIIRKYELLLQKAMMFQSDCLPAWVSKKFRLPRRLYFLSFYLWSLESY
jgi:RimJ/RimL family protein N-acetyltransferase